MIEFSCCSRYASCDYGRNECFFEEIEPSKKERCRCYKIKHNDAFQNSEKCVNREINPQTVESKAEEMEMGQLSLF